MSTKTSHSAKREKPLGRFAKRLKGEWESRLAKNPELKKSAFAAEAGISPGFLSDILGGTKSGERSERAILMNLGMPLIDGIQNEIATNKEKVTKIGDLRRRNLYDRIQREHGINVGKDLEELLTHNDFSQTMVVVKWIHTLAESLRLSRKSTPQKPRTPKKKIPA